MRSKEGWQDPRHQAISGDEFLWPREFLGPKRARQKRVSLRSFWDSRWGM